MRYRDGRDAARVIEHRVDGLRLVLPMLSNLPADVATEVQPLIEARIDGSVLRLDGQARPFVAERPADLHRTDRPARGGAAAPALDQLVRRRLPDAARARRVRAGLRRSSGRA